METDTKLIKTCSKCEETKDETQFKSKRSNICKKCRNNTVRNNYNQNTLLCEDQPKKCHSCEEEKNISEFIKNRNICKLCNNKDRRNKYEANDEHRKKLIENASNFKKRKIAEKTQQREEIRLQLESEIGPDNTICKYCNEIRPKTRFRFNRLKCADCERDDPLEKFKRIIRSRVYIALHYVKEKHTIDYLGCNTTEYIQWIQYNSQGFTIENHGKEWHIYHVIPLSKFYLANEEEQMVAFNWRNTTALSVRDNFTKNNKIIKSQVKQHIEKLVSYHNQNNIELPQKYIDLFAKYLDDGKPLKISLPLNSGNAVEELS